MHFRVSNREQLSLGRFFEGPKKYTENKNEGNENKIIFGDFDYTVSKMERNAENRTKRLYRCCSIYTMSKLIAGNGLQDL